MMRKLRSGWWYVTAATRGVAGGAQLVLQFDPADEMPAHGVKRIEFTPEEVERLVSDLRAAQARTLGRAHA